MITVPTLGQADWGVPLNTALNDLQAQVLVNTTASQPSIQGLLAWSYDSEIAGSTNLLTSGTVYLTKMVLPEPITVTNVHLTVETAGSTLTAGQNLLGLYSSSGARLGVSADMTAAFGSSGFKTGVLTAPVSITTAGVYYAAVLSVGTTPITVASSPGLQATFNANVTGATLRHAIAATAQTSLPNPITMSSNTSTGVSPWMALT
jgi:hypothetical protein